MTLRYLVSQKPVDRGAVIRSRDQQEFTLADFDEEFVYVLPKGHRVRTERYRPQFFQLEVVTA